MTEYATTADMLERIAQQTYRMSYGIPGPAREMRKAAEDAAAEFDRLWEAKRRPVLNLTRVLPDGTENYKGRLVLQVTDGGSVDDGAPDA